VPCLPPAEPPSTTTPPSSTPHTAPINNATTAYTDIIPTPDHLAPISPLVSSPPVTRSPLIPPAVSPDHSPAPASTPLSPAGVELIERSRARLKDKLRTHVAWSRALSLVEPVRPQHVVAPCELLTSIRDSTAALDRFDTVDISDVAHAVVPAAAANDIDSDASSCCSHLSATGQSQIELLGSPQRSSPPDGCATTTAIPDDTPSSQIGAARDGISTPAVPFAEQSGSSTSLVLSPWPGETPGTAASSSSPHIPLRRRFSLVAAALTPPRTKLSSNTLHDVSSTGTWSRSRRAFAAAVGPAAAAAAALRSAFPESAKTPPGPRKAANPPAKPSSVLYVEEANISVASSVLNTQAPAPNLSGFISHKLRKVQAGAASSRHSSEHISLKQVLMLKLRPQHATQHGVTAMSPTANIASAGVRKFAADATQGVALQAPAAPTALPPQRRRSAELQRHGAVPCAAVGEPRWEGLTQRLQVLPSTTVIYSCVTGTFLRELTDFQELDGQAMFLMHWWP
jgi:hypothetical protein